MRDSLEKLGSRITYANVVSTLALVIAVGGGGVAANAALANNTVGSPQIKNGQVKSQDLGSRSVSTSKIRNNSVLSRHVKNGNLQGKDIKNGSLTSNDLKANAIIASLLGPDSVTSAAIAPDAVTSGAIANGAVSADDLTAGQVGVARAYAWNNVPAGALGVSNVLNNGYVYNSTGGQTSVTRSGVGEYSVLFSGVEVGAGTVHVTAYGSDADQCKVQSWGDDTVRVRCFNAAGNPANSLFTVAFYR